MEQHKGINQYYDIPSISLRNPFLPQVIDNFKAVEKFFHRQDGKKGEMEGMDLRHVCPVEADDKYRADFADQLICPSYDR